MSVRLRIAFSTASIMLLVLVVLGSGIYLTMSRSLHEDLDQRLSTVFASYQRDPGQLFLSSGRIELRTNPDPFASSGVYIQILQSDGSMGARSENLGNETLPITADILSRNRAGERVFYTDTSTEQSLRILAAPLFSGGAIIGYVQVAEPLGPIENTLGGLQRNLIIGGILATLVAGAGGAIVGDASMRPLSRIAGAAGAVGRTGDLSRRLPSPRTGDEVELLAEAFNDMLARLEETFNAQRRFVADASHELRTPLTALRANSDIMLRQLSLGVVDHEDLIEGLSGVQAEVDRMTRLVQNLLTLARADVGWRPELEPIDAVEVVRDAARIASSLTRGQRFELDAPIPVPGEDSSIVIYGNADQLTQLILILLDNAFAYSPPDSDVTLSVMRNDDDAIIAVTDTGHGIPEDHLARIFERFFRADDARARDTGGAGLGLSIARWIVQVHDGDIDVQSTVGEGTTFTVRIPLAGPGADSLFPFRSAEHAAASV